MPQLKMPMDIAAEEGIAAEMGVVAKVWPLHGRTGYTVSCNGDTVGHDCTSAGSAFFEDGDTWWTVDAAVSFAAEHIGEHEDRDKS